MRLFDYIFKSEERKKEKQVKNVLKRTDKLIKKGEDASHHNASKNVIEMHKFS